MSKTIRIVVIAVLGATVLIAGALLVDGSDGVRGTAGIHSGR